MTNASRPIKILIISHTAGTRGAERSLLLLLEKIDRRLFDPVVVVPWSGDLTTKLKEIDIVVETTFIPWWIMDVSQKHGLFTTARLELGSTFQLVRLINKHKIDIVYTNTIVTLTGAIAAKITNRPHIWHIREILTDNPHFHLPLSIKNITKLINKLSSTIIVNSKATAEQFKSYIPGFESEVIYNAQDRPPKLSRMLPNDLTNGGKSWPIAFVGTLIERKAPDDAIKAIAIAKAVIPEIRLIIIGDGPAEFTKKLNTLVAELNVSDNILFAGYRDDVPQVLSGCKAVLVPSWNEPFGRVVIEGMAAQLPVIGSNSGGIKEIIDDGLTGYLTPPRSPEAISEKLIKLYQNPKLASRLGQRGEEVVMSKFSVENYVGLIEMSFKKAAGIQ